MSAIPKFFVSLLLLFIGGSSSGVWAQSRPERPYRGLFDQGGVSQSEQSVSVNGSVGGGYDTSVAADASEAGLGNGATSRTQSQGGSYALLSGGISYSLSKKRFSLNASEGSSARYYPTFASTFAVSHSAAIGASYSPSDRTSFSATQTITYQPFTLFSLFPQLQPPGLGQIVSSDLDYIHNLNSYFTYATGIGFSHQFSRRSTLTAGYNYQRYTYGSPSASDFMSQGGSVQFTHSLSAGFGIRLGYGYSEGTYGFPVKHNVGHHQIDSGIDYSRTLSFSRRTKLSFSTGASAVRDAVQTYYGAIGSATLTREIGRTWALYAAYNRNVNFVETFVAPVFYDSASVGLNGLVSRRISFHASAGVTRGHVGLSSAAAPNNGFDSDYATAGIGRALNRFVSIGIDYSYYRYLFDQSDLLPAGFRSDSSRHSVRATLSAGAPIFQSTRRRNASR